MIINTTKNKRELNLIKKWLTEGHETIKFKEFKPITFSNFEIISKTNGNLLFMDNHKELPLFNDWLNPDFALYNPSLTYSLKTMYNAYRNFDNNLKQHQINKYIESMKNNAETLTKQYICNCIFNENDPFEKIDEMLSDNKYPAFLLYPSNNDREFIDSYIKLNSQYNEDFDIPCKPFDYLTPKEQEKTCLMYFDCELVSVRASLENFINEL